MVFLTVALFVVAITIAIYYYITPNENFFKKHGILHNPPSSWLGNMGPLINRKRNLHEVILEAYNIHSEAKYVGFYEFQTPIIILRDPDLIKSVTIKNWEYFTDHRSFTSKETDHLLGAMLFNMVGEEWKEQRAMLTPMFTSSKIKNMFKLMSSCAIRFTGALSKFPENEREMDIKNLLCRYTNDVIASCVYGVSVDTMKEPKNVFYVYGRNATSLLGFKKALIMFLHRNLPKLAVFLRLRLVNNKMEKFFTDLVKDTVKAREENGIYRPDMIQLMMDIKNKKEGLQNMTPFNMAAHAFTFFFGGFDTVSTACCYAMHLLAEYPEAQAKLQEEIDEALEKSNGEISYEVMGEMKYLDAVINETLRLYPIVYFIDRVCIKEFELPPALPGAKPFIVKPGMNLWVPSTAIHRDPRYYDNPDKFDPDRFLDDGKRILSSNTFIPFGMGPRSCIGNRFALTKVKVVLCHLFARFDLKIGPKTHMPLTLMKGVFNMMPENGFWLKVEPRKNPHPSTVVNGTVNGVANGVC